ncbi:ZIP family metal transporter [Candidatus Saganbacteria bacterium]|nr:ZIP family metal transporter [Candidatus Saganbacteria bacterium]
MIIWFSSLIAVVLISLVSLLGIFTLAIKKERLARLILFMVSFAVGALFGDAFIHLIPEASEKLGSGVIVPALVLTGILLFFILEKFILWRHCHHPTTEKHPHPVVFMNLVGDGVHNLIDGMVVAASFMVSFPVGLATTVAVVLHEIPQEIGDFGVLIHSGLSVQRALLFNFASALLAILGAIITLILGPYIKNYSIFVLPLTAGGFIYMAGSDLIPFLHDEQSGRRALLQFLFILLGIATMFSLLLL